MVWADAHLTDIGIEQAKAVNRFWSLEVSTQKIPVPQIHYTSPLNRCLATAKVTFTGLATKWDQPFKPVVKEVSLKGRRDGLILSIKRSFYGKFMGFIRAIGVVTEPTFISNFPNTLLNPGSQRTMSCGSQIVERTTQTSISVSRSF